MLSIDEGGDPARLAHVTLSDFLARLARRTVADATGQERKGWVYDATLAPTPAPTGPSARRYALIVDQFEEIITGHPARWREREDFFRQLDQAMQADPNLWVVLTLREDYVAALDPYAPLMADRLRARFYMERMGVEAALDAIRQPAELARPPLCAGRGRAAGGQPAPGARAGPGDDRRRPVRGAGAVAGGLLPVVGEHQGTGRPGLITATDLREAGDVDRALTQFYEETLAAVLADPASGRGQRAAVARLVRRGADH